MSTAKEGEINITNMGSRKSVEIAIQDISYSVMVKASKKGPNKTQYQEKKILHSVSGVFKPNRLTAVMGASGAGKTSLLNVMAGEIKSGDVQGKILVNGKSMTSPKEMKLISGFVFQDDVILDTMTVREAITMSAVLRLPQTIPLSEKMQKVDELIKLLKLTAAQNTVIGSAVLKGISGGERKRTACAMEMITNPAVLFLDEPTSGLDTFTAYTVVDILKSLCKSGKTIIATIHQPSSEIFHMFDDLCLLSQGKVLYNGPVEMVVEYFSKLGYPCPTYSNPADYIFMSILNTEKSSSNKDLERISSLLIKWNESEENKVVHKDLTLHMENVIGYGNDMVRKPSNFITQFKLLLQRAAKNALRNKFVLQAKFVQGCFIALLIGLIYKNAANTGTINARFQNVSGVLFFVGINMLMSSVFMILNVFGQEKIVFVREHGNGFYSLPAYFFSKIIVELPILIIIPVIQSSIMYFMIGLSTLNWYTFLVFMIITVLMTNCGTALGIFFTSIFRDLNVALAVTPAVILPLMIFSGFFVNNDTIPDYFDWIKYLSPMFYGFQGLLKNQFAGWTLEETKNGINITRHGDDFIANLGFDNGITIEYVVLILFGFYLGFLALAFLGLYRSVSGKSEVKYTG